MDNTDLDAIGASYSSLNQYVDRYESAGNSSQQERERSYYFIRTTLPELCLLQGKVKQIEESDKTQIPKDRIQEFEKLSSDVEELAKRIQDSCFGFYSYSLNDLRIQNADLNSPDLRAPLPENEKEKNLNWISTKLEDLEKEVDRLDPYSLDSFIESSQKTYAQIKVLRFFLNTEYIEIRENRIREDRIKEKIQLLNSKFKNIEGKDAIKNYLFKLNKYREAFNNYVEYRMVHGSRSMEITELFRTAREDMELDYRRIVNNFQDNPSIRESANQINKKMDKLIQDFQEVKETYTKLEGFKRKLESHRERQLLSEQALQNHPDEIPEELVEKIKKEMIALHSLRDEIIGWVPTCRKDKIKNEELVEMDQGISKLLNYYEELLDRMGIQFVVQTSYKSIDETVARYLSSKPEELAVEMVNNINALSLEVKNRIDYFTLLYPNGSEILSNWQILKEKIVLFFEIINDLADLGKRMTLFIAESRKEGGQVNPFTNGLYSSSLLISNIFYVLNNKLKSFINKHGKIDMSSSYLKYLRDGYVAHMTNCLKIWITDLRKEFAELPHPISDITKETDLMKGIDISTKLEQIESLLKSFEGEIGADVKNMLQELKSYMGVDLVKLGMMKNMSEIRKAIQSFKSKKQ